MIFRDALFRGKPNEALRRQATAIFEAAVRAADPVAAVLRHVSLAGSTLRIGAHSYDLRAIARIVVIGAGKASAPMAQALESLLGDRIAAGVVNVKYGYTAPLRRVTLVEAGHPIPDEAGRRGAERMLALVGQAGQDDLALCVISGGGSALLPAPVGGLSLEEKARVTDMLLKSGAAITEVNTVRKHLSKIKGGQLARAAAPAQVAVLILSDVLGNPLDAIASGPAVPDPTTFAEALAVIHQYGLAGQLPHAALEYLKRGADGLVPETPKPGAEIFERVHTVIVGNNETTVEAAATQARAAGFRTVVLPPITGEARQAGASFADQTSRQRSGPLPACVLAGGETTVTVHGTGKGGRCQEFALAASLRIAGQAAVLVAGFGTDGTDGPTDAAGALVDGSTIDRARAAGVEVRRALDHNDAYTFFSALSDLIVTGPTNTNVNDLYLALIGRGGVEQ